MLDEIKIPLSISDLVSDSIRRGIISGELKAGQKISVSEMSEILKVSATPVKQAFKSLQTEGLLITKPRSGTTISDLAMMHLQFTMLIRSAVEGVAAHIAALVIADPDLKKLENILHESDRAIERNDLESLVKTNACFHKTIREVTGSSYLDNLVANLISFDYSFRRSALQTLKERELGSKEHWEVYKFIKEHNPEKAEKALSDHIRRSASTVVPKN
jgi:DNA-binding GntR family transcriptional regulator